MINKFSMLLTAMLLHPFLSFSDYSNLDDLFYHLSGGQVIRRICTYKNVQCSCHFISHLINDCYFVLYIENFMTREKYYSIISPIFEEAKNKFSSLDTFLKSTNQDLRKDYYESLINLIACHFNLLLDNKNNNIKQDDFNKAKNKMSQAIKNINVDTNIEICTSNELQVVLDLINKANLDLINKANKEIYKNISIFTRISSLFI